jgi:hypothetical protein
VEFSSQWRISTANYPAANKVHFVMSLLPGYPREQPAILSKAFDVVASHGLNITEL